jgi:hypothetical protein
VNHKGVFSAVVAFAVLAGAVTWVSSKEKSPPHPAVPEKHEENGYLGSGACRSCHPGEHASWRESYHSTMTREPDALSWNGQASPELPVLLELYSRSYRIFLEDDRVMVSGPDLHAVGKKLSALSGEGDASRPWKRRQAEEIFGAEAETTRELVLVTGSHHYLAFWLEGGHEKELRQLPFVYLLAEGRFLPREEAFLQPPDALPHVARWNANCVQCHTVAGKPRQSEGRHSSNGEFWESFDTSVAEFGVACESCHGPGATHAQHFRNPLSRALSHSSPGDRHIYLPDEHSGPRGSETCGQCHSYFVPRDENEWWNSGFSTNYQAGDPLDVSRLLLRPAEDGGEAGREALLAEQVQAQALISAHRSSIFWNDGSMIVGGREYNGLIESPCFGKGNGQQRLGCTHCHSLHEGSPDGQVKPAALGNTMCTQCHSNMESEHSRHSATSAASLCESCHMPKTSYALLSGLASHRISSPQARFESPPNACVLCHVDRPESWFRRELAHFGVDEKNSSPDVSPQLDELPLAAIRALSGNAAERAIYAFALGSSETLEASGSEISKRVLPLLKSDPYAAVRFIAERSLREVEQHAPRGVQKNRLRLEDSTLTRLFDARDETPIVISE